MVKRPAENASRDTLPAKRPRLQPDRLSALSEELLLRILSNLTIQELNVCQRVSSPIRRLAGDSQLWKSAYYNRFVRPRLDRLVRRKSHNVVLAVGEPASRTAQWLDESDLVKRGDATNWKRQYRIRHNWSIGSCDVSEIPVTVRAPSPPLLARLQDGIVYTVDMHCGLRAWAYKDTRTLLGFLPVEQRTGMSENNKVTSIALEPVAERDCQRIAVGYEDGSFSLFGYNKRTQTFKHHCTRSRSLHGAVTALAMTSSHVFCMSDSQVLSLYYLDKSHDQEQGITYLEPLLLNSLRSQTAWPPLSISIRPRGANLLASIAYCMPTYTSGWSTGIQEVLFSASGTVLESRLASAAEQGFTSLARDSRIIASQPNSRTDAATSVVERTPDAQPTSLSYSHPYLLVSHNDNTLTLHMVTSTSSHLSINPGRKLWGHTSSVFGAHVGTRGKAVSVSARGDEIRVWELEGGLSRYTPTGELLGESSVQISPEKPKRPLGDTGNAIKQQIYGGCGAEAENIAITRGWVGFDEESVVVLRERQEGLQALTVFDFS